MALTQAAYRFGGNDGTEATHSFLAALNTAISRDRTDQSTFLVRVLVQNDAVAVNNADFQLQRSLNGGAFANVTTTSTVVKAVTTAVFADQANTTSRLGGTGTFEATSFGCSHTGLCGGPQFDIVASGRGEVLYAVQMVSADLAPGNTITFRLLVDGATFTVAQTPTINVTGVTTNTLTTSLEAVALAQGILATATLNTAGQTRLTATASLNAIGVLVGTITAALDAIARAQRTAGSTIDAAAQLRASTVTTTLDAASRTALSLATSFDASGISGLATEIVAVLDAAAQLRRTATLTLDAAGQLRTQTASATLDAAAGQAISLTTSFDANSIEVAPSQHRVSGTVLDAAGRAAMVLAASLDALAARHASAVATMEAIGQTRVQIALSFDAVVGDLRTPGRRIVRVPGLAGVDVPAQSRVVTVRVPRPQ